MVKLDTTLTVNIDKLLKDCLKDEAQRRNVSLSWLVRKYILDGFSDSATLAHYYKKQMQMLNPLTMPKNNYGGTQ